MGLVNRIAYWLYGIELPGNRPFFNFESRTLGNNRHMDSTRYNPATGLPMMGGLDCMGNSIGSSASDRHHHTSTSSHHHSSSHTSSFSHSSSFGNNSYHDPFKTY